MILVSWRMTQAAVYSLAGFRSQKLTQIVTISYLPFKKNIITKQTGEFGSWHHI